MSAIEHLYDWGEAMRKDSPGNKNVIRSVLPLVPPFVSQGDSPAERRKKVHHPSMAVARPSLSIVHPMRRSRRSIIIQIPASDHMHGMIYKRFILKSFRMT